MKTYHLITAVIGTFIIALAVWSGLIFGSMWFGAKAYERGDYEAAEDYYQTAERVSPLDKWRPDFGQGTALLAQDEINRGIAKLEEALETVPKAEVFEGGVKDPESYECLVRANLYLGYAAADRDEDAEEVIQTCPNPNPNATSSGEEGDEGDEGDEGGEGD
ncbi:MAG: tetratricopeptide repeat protein, partial [Flaviflexus sp.]|uniref:tetratricopeptide repeat protein n=1 Tax=Flaviflexus sp. TaxID=1969482 RepID=UPI003F928E55